MRFKPSNRSELIAVFKKLDDELFHASEKMKIKVLGGASVLLLGVRERATADIDIAATNDANRFQKMCAKIEVEVDIITIASTVDLTHCNSISVYRGKNLTVDSVVPSDLLKLKLERFYKQDPEDIYAIIEHEAMSFDEFKKIVKEMRSDFIGNVRQLIISARIVVEQIWPDKVEEFDLFLE